jgi:hypothetical protein
MSNFRKDREREFFTHHMPTFKNIGIADPFFTIKTAFFQKGKYGRHVQFFEWELKKGEDIYVEFYDNKSDDSGKTVDITPMYGDRPLFKFKSNPFYSEEYEKKENFNDKGETYITYVVPVNECVAVLNTGQEISYALYEKRKDEAKLEVPQLQKSLSIFPDFEETFPPKAEIEISNEEIADVPLSEITIRDLAAIMLMKPVSARPWLNDLIKQTKSEI